MKHKKLIAVALAAAVCIPQFNAMAVKAAEQNTQASKYTYDKHSIRISGINDKHAIRIAGIDRYQSSIQISQYGWEQADNVFISGAESNMDFADATAGSTLAYDMDAPILLTETKKLSDGLNSELERLKCKNIYILGGLAVVSQEVENEFRKKGYNVTRISGNTRYETALKIAQILLKRHPDQKNSVTITTGNQFQYAISAAANASENHSIILFSDGYELNSEVENLLTNNKSITKISVLGGDPILSVKSKLYLNHPDLFSIYKYDTVDQLFSGEGCLGNLDNFPGIGVASSRAFPDAVCASVLTSKKGYKLLLSDGEKLSYNVDKSKFNLMEEGLIFGGSGLISYEVQRQVEDMLVPGFKLTNP